MKHSRRYRTVKEKINNNYYPLAQGLSFLQGNNPEKLKNIKVSKIAVVKDDLPVDTVKRFERLVVHPQNEKKFRLPEKLPPKLFGLIARKVSLNENIKEEIEKFQKGEKELKTDRSGNIQAVIGKSNFSLEQLTENYQAIYNKINVLRPAK
ncbi:6828_t:CDS:2 [Funneliformis geosporum]|uniref:6828_t:CDS:1 n=1 Tax=Funneliformis geosporum TaxID=1117311 RepID=A0A9W4SAG3_9GLOM|nr:6828_t:CDS:2 [Funneliformis geosporum]